MTSELKMREALEDLAAYGIHADTMPTMANGTWDTTHWYQYLERADNIVRSIARAGLEETE